jgi:adenylate cyclase
MADRDDSESPDSPAEATAGAPCRVFMSYAAPDVALAEKVCSALEAAGFPCWIAPRDVQAGEAYAAAIVEAISACRLMVLVLTKSAIHSRHVFREIERASSKDHQVLSIRMDTAELPPELEYFLSAEQWLDASGGPVERIFPALIEAVRGHYTGKRAYSEGPRPAAPGAGRAPVSGPDAHAPHTSSHAHGLPSKFSFLEEFKHRNVGRVAILYIAVCYLLLESFSTFLHVLALPEWTGRAVAVLMILGFPAALIFAWVYEITPEGLKPTVEVEPSRSIKKQTGKRLNRAIIIVLALVLAYFAADKFWLSKRSLTESATAPAAIAPVAVPAAPSAPATAAIAEKSVAVLPFVDMSEKKDQEYFSDGLSEELIDMLTRIPDLRVPARTSSFYFKGKQVTIAEIAKALGVAHVLEGSVRKSGSTLRVTAQLIRVDNGYHLWSQTYDRKLDDVFKVQDEIAGAVVSALKVSLADSSTLKVTTAKNSEAYTLYLQGRAINRIASNKQQYESAAEYMRKAIKADPTFAKAWAGLALALMSEVTATSEVSGNAVAAEVRGASERAFALDSNLPEVHLANGSIYLNLDWNWEAATAEFQKAYDLNPDDAASVRALGDAQLNFHGASDTVLALTLYQKAIELDPVNFNNYEAIGWYYMWTGRLLEAEAALRKAIDLLPTGPGVHAALGVALLLRGEAAAALAEFQRDPDESEQRPGTAMAYFALGRRAEANAKLSEMERLDATTNASSIAETYAYGGEIDQAFAWLDRSYQQRESNLWQTNRDPLMKSLHGDPRWKAFLRKMNLPE